MGKKGTNQSARKYPEDVICIYCKRNALNALMAQAQPEPQCASCQVSIRRGFNLNPNRKPAPTEDHICPGCGLYKGRASKWCRDCSDQQVKRKNVIPVYTDSGSIEYIERVAHSPEYNLKGLNTWLEARRQRLNQYA